MTAKSNSNIGDKLVFLVDDDQDLILQNKIILEGHGLKTKTANSGKEAIQELEKGTPDLMIVDVMMENLTAGLSLARDIGEKYPNLPVIILSGDPQKPNWMLQDSKTWNSVRYFLDKPVTEEKLIATIEEVFKNART